MKIQWLSIRYKLLAALTIIPLCGLAVILWLATTTFTDDKLNSLNDASFWVSKTRASRVATELNSVVSLSQAIVMNYHSDTKNLGDAGNAFFDREPKLLAFQIFALNSQADNYERTVENSRLTIRDSLAKKSTVFEKLIAQARTDGMSLQSANDIAPGALMLAARYGEANDPQHVIAVTVFDASELSQVFASRTTDHSYLVRKSDSQPLFPSSELEKGWGVEQVWAEVAKRKSPEGFLEVQSPQASAFLTSFADVGTAGLAVVSLSDKAVALASVESIKAKSKFIFVAVFAAMMIVSAMISQKLAGAFAEIGFQLRTANETNPPSGSTLSEAEIRESVAATVDKIVDEASFDATESEYAPKFRPQLQMVPRAPIPQAEPTMVSEAHVQEEIAALAEEIMPQSHVPATGEAVASVHAGVEAVVVVASEVQVAASAAPGDEQLELVAVVEAAPVLEEESQLSFLASAEPVQLHVVPPVEAVSATVVEEVIPHSPPVLTIVPRVEAAVVLPVDVTVAAVPIAETAQPVVVQEERKTSVVVELRPGRRPFGDTESVKRSAVEISGLTQSPADKEGNDWWQTFEKGDKIYIGMGSLSVRAGEANALKEIIQNVFTNMQSGPAMAPGAAMETLNRAVFEKFQGRSVMTFFLASLDKLSGELVYVNASHRLPLVLRATSHLASPADFSPLEPVNNPRIGAIGHYQFQEARSEIRSGDRFVLFSDGSVDVLSPGGKVWGEHRFLESLAFQFFGTQENGTASVQSTEHALKGVVENLNSFRSGQPLEQDASFIIVRFGKRVVDYQPAREAA